MTTPRKRSAGKVPAGRRVPALPSRVPGASIALTREQRDQFERQLEEWWIEARDKHAQSRLQRFIDHDYYDHEQISPEDRAVYEERGQAPIVHNLVHPAIDWLTGTERRTRIDWKILPRGPEDVQGAEAQTHLMKYVSDANHAPFERSRAFKDSCISGLGLMEEYLRRDEFDEPVGFGYLDWRYFWWDPFSRHMAFKDARYCHRVKFTDLDRAMAMFPGAASDLRTVSVSTIDNEFILLDELDELPAMFALSGSHSSTGLRSVSAVSDRFARRRVRLIETWYWRAEASKRIVALVADASDLHGLTFDERESELREKLESGIISLTDALSQKMAMAIWSPGLGILKHQYSPYRHNQYPFTPIWCFRHHRDGMPYGYVRGMRDPQDEYNKRRAKALFAASVNRVLYEHDAFEEEDERDSLDEIARMNGEVRLAPGGLKKIEIQTGLEVANTHVNFMAEAKQQIYEGSGITRENLAHDTNAISGRAILAKQQQGAVTTAEVFDNFRLAVQISGRKLLELIKAGMATPRKVRVLGGNDGIDWVAINEPTFDPVTGEVRWENDILNTMSDFVVAEQDFRETVRMAMAESLFEVIAKMPPEMALQLIDLAVELTDLPNKDEFVRRVRQISGAAPAPADPAAEEEAAAQRDAAARAAQLEADERAAKIEKDRAQAENLRANARKTLIGARAEALDTAAMVSAALPLAPAADELFAGAAATPPQPVPPGVVHP